MTNKIANQWSRIAAVVLITLAGIWPAAGQLVLLGTNYTQNFDSISSGLPPGWSMRTGASTNSLGTAATFTGATKTWSDTGGNFGNCASVSGYGTNFIGTEVTATQNGGTNRSLAIRQGASFGDPGAAFVLQIANTVGITNLAFSLDLNLLGVQGRSTVWTIDYAVSNSPSAFTTLATFNDPGVFGATPSANFTLNSDADDQSQNVWIRVVALTAATGSGSRDTFGIDNFSLSYSNVNASVPATSPVITNQPVSLTNAVLTIAVFSVGASGTPPLYYQWYKDGVRLTNGSHVSGAASDTLTLSQLFHTNAGVYQVVVTNAAASANSVTSSPSTTLTVIGFGIVPILPTNTIAGTPLTIGLNFIDNQTPVTTAFGVSGNQSIFPNSSIAASASGSSGSVTMTPLAGANGVVLVYLTASDGTFSTNTSFPLVVVPSSEVIFNDHFDYADGSVTAASLGLWRNHSGPTNQMIATNGELRVSRSLDEDASALLIGQPYETNSAAVLFSRFKVKFSTLPAAGGNYFAHFIDASGSGPRARIWATSAGAASGKFRLGIGNAGTSTAISSQFPLDLELNTNYTIITRLVVSNGVSTIWINPTSEADTSTTAGDAVADQVAISAYAFRQDSSEGIMLVDDLVVGTSFQSVLGAASPIPLSIQLNGANAILSWTDSTFALQSSTNAVGTYNTIPGATSPHTNPATGGQKYFRLIK